MNIREILRTILLLANLLFTAAAINFFVIMLLAGLLGRTDDFFVGDDLAKMQALGFWRHVLFAVSMALTVALMMAGAFITERLRKCIRD